MFNTDLSGVRLTTGQAIRAKALRSSRAWPDLFIPEPRKGHYGLFIELKREGERLYTKDGRPASDHIKAQDGMIQELRSRGYMAVFACGFDQARGIIDNYFKATE